jgi:hypothetical protein
MPDEVQPIQTPQEAPAPQPAPQATQPASGDWAVKRSVLRVLLLSFVSFGLYALYWFYVTRQRVTRELGSDDNAGLQTLGMFVPILNYVIYYWLYRDVDKLQRSAGASGFQAVLYAVLMIISPINIIILALVISELNKYWDTKSGGQATEAKFTGGEIAVTVLGAAMWLFFFVLMVLGVFAAASTIETTNTYSY